MESLLETPHLSLMAPILIGESVMALKSARMIFAVLRALAANYVASTPKRELKGAANAHRQHEAYAHAETLMEIRVMQMLALVGVIGVQWFLNVPTGKSVWLIETAIATTLQLFIHLIVSVLAVFWPEKLTDLILFSAHYPLSFSGVFTVLLLIFDSLTHVSNAAFLAAAIRNKAAAAVIFGCSVMFYKLVDQGITDLGLKIKRLIEKEKRELLEEEQGGVDGDEQNTENDGQRHWRRQPKAANKKKKKKN